MKARPRKPPEKDRRDRGPPPEQRKCYGGVPSPLPSDLCNAQLPFQLLCLGRVTKTMSVAPLLTNNLDNSSTGSPAFLAQLHLPTRDLFWAKLRVQLHLPPVRSLDLLISPGTLRTIFTHIYLLTRADLHVLTGEERNHFRAWVMGIDLYHVICT